LRRALLVLSLGLSAVCAGRAHANLITRPAISVAGPRPATASESTLPFQTPATTMSTSAPRRPSPVRASSRRRSQRRRAEATISGFALLDEAGFIGDTFTVSFGLFTTTITGDEAAAPGDLPSFYTGISFTIPGSEIAGTSTTLSFQG
jgi:hypothetical protein